MDKIAPKDGIKDAKASQKDNSQDSNDTSDDKSAVGAQQDANTTQNVSQPSAKSATSGKTEKSNNEKQAVLAETDDETPDESQLAATTLQLLSLQNVPPAVQPVIQAPVAQPSTDTGDDLKADAAAPAAQTPSSANIQPGTSPADAPARTPQPAAAQDDQQDDETAADSLAQAPQSQTPQSQAPQPQIDPAQPGKPVSKPQTASVKKAGDPAPQPANDETVTRKDVAAAPADAPKAKADAKPAAGKSDAVKAPKADFGKSRFAQDTKTDPDKGTVDKTAQPAAAVPQADEISEPPKPAPQPVQALSNNPLINPNTQAGNVPANPIAVAHVTQHLQVTATPAPNLPALAVEIAAKSQSGAKQFDIRLDPPELGRVEVRLSIDATGKASAHLSADQPQTLNLLQKDASVLTRALRDAGLDVSQDGLNFSLRQQGDNNQSAGNGNRRGSSRSFSLSATTGIDASATTAAYRAPVNGRLDIRV